MSHIALHETGDNFIPNVTEFWYLQKLVILRNRATMVREITCLPKFFMWKIHFSACVQVFENIYIDDVYIYIYIYIYIYMP